MKKIIIPACLLLLGLFAFVSLANAATCEVKLVCLDNNHVGYQDADCKITSADEIAKALGEGNSTYSCYTGCQDGVCIKDNTPYTCTDSDGGKDYFTKGDIFLKGDGEQGSASDYCIDKDDLMEYSCNKESAGRYFIQASPYNCPNGCANGVCIKVPGAAGPTGSTCTDSDGGKDIFRAGEITINGKKLSVFDTCGFDPQTINEKLCLPDGTYSSEDLKCPGLCEFSIDGAHCANSCAKSLGYYCHDTADGQTGIAYLTQDCKWEKGTPCQSNSCSSGRCISAGYLADTDGDGLLDTNESLWGTNLNKFDTDGDGFGDMAEISGGYNPLGPGRLSPEQQALVQTMNSSPAPAEIVATTTFSEPLATPSEENIVAQTGTPSGLAATATANNRSLPSIQIDQGAIMVNLLPPELILILVLFFLALYVYSSICLQLIARKLSVAPAWLAWIPIVNIYLQIKCAGKPWWWLLLFLFVPLANIIVFILVWISICQKLSRPAWLVILLFISPLNLIVLGYLAFSGAKPQMNNPVPPVQTNL